MNIKKIVSFLPFLLSFVTFIYVGVGVTHSSYNLLFLLPLFYFICFGLFLYKRLNYKNISVFFIVFNIVVFSRYVILPFFIVYAGYYGGRALTIPTHDVFNIAHIIMVYELIATSVFASYLEKKNRRFSHNSKLHMTLGFNKNIVIIIFILCVLLFLSVSRDWLLAVNFFVSNPLEIELTGDAMLSSYLLILIKQIIFIYIVYYMAKLYSKKKKIIYLIVTFIAMITNIGIFVGTNRSDVLVPAIVSLLLISKLFTTKVAKGMSIIIFICVFALISQITETRNFSSISKGNSELIDRTDFLQVYLGGPYNVAIAVDTKESYPEAGKLEVLFFDIFRPMIGVNFLVKNLDIKYSNIYFNHRIFKSDNRSQIIPMVGQSNLFFGVLLSPLLSVLFVFLAYRLNKFIVNSTNPLIYYFFTLSVARMGFLMGQNTMNMINDLSFNIFLFLIIFWLNKKIKL
ncbi:hypothetical protein [Chryseobacterium sp. CFBP8996]|uniref:hypothetical protein n=1 Tax=Chryseobacterium sp. CFBP8996 TaxID=3096529 RepID=UPI002A6B445E|nr:hypothetical protein [Chryseobacterium sp. CFBP8996]MDY0933054.1 hypothetical protein [Chryseobacterium sp. CFBP8996]